MTISDYVFEQNIKKYAELLKKEYILKAKLSMIHDELINLSMAMTNEDINEAQLLFKDLMENIDF